MKIAKIFEIDVATLMKEINRGVKFNLVAWYENITESTDGFSRTKNMNNTGLNMNPCFKYSLSTLKFSRSNLHFDDFKDFSRDLDFLDNFSLVFFFSYKINTTTIGMIQRTNVNLKSSVFGNISKNRPPKNIAIIENKEVAAIK